MALDIQKSDIALKFTTTGKIPIEVVRIGSDGSLFHYGIELENSDKVKLALLEMARSFTLEGLQSKSISIVPDSDDSHFDL